MYGFTITVNGLRKARKDDICYKNIICSNHMIKKFEQDKFFAETDSYIIMLDGVILNRKALLTKIATIIGEDFETPWLDCIITLYVTLGELFIKELRGSFTGAIYDKKKDKWIVYGDQIGSKFTFFTKVGDFFCVCEEMGQMYRMMSENNVNYVLSTDAAFLMLTFGFMIDDKTLCEQVRKIQPGCYIVYENGTITEKTWYVLNNTFDFSISEEEAIDIVDSYFRQAVNNAFCKDAEYGFNHIVALSGGLDSRMTSFVAHDLGFTKQLNFTFSQSDYLDETIPKQIARDLEHEWIFKSLDNGLWLYDIDEITKHTGGNVIYYGSSHSNSLYKLLNFDGLGIIHTGQVSGGLNGSSVRQWDESFDHFDYQKAMYSTKYFDYVKHMLTKQINQELGWYYYRCLNGTCYGTQIIYNYTESYSPFLDVDFIEHVLHIPITYRMSHGLYKKWILKKYPMAAKYIWEKHGHRITAPTLRIGNREMTYDAIINRSLGYLIKKLGFWRNQDRIKGMNPIDYYVSHNEDLRKFISSYFQYVEAIQDTELRRVIRDIQNDGSSIEKLQAISILAAVKLFYA